MIADTLNYLSDANVQRLLSGQHHDPSQILGRHLDGPIEVVRVLLPGARNVRIEPLGVAMQPLGNSGLLIWEGAPGLLPKHYEITWTEPDGTTCRQVDPYTFPLLLDERAIDSFNQGEHHRAWRLLGAHAQVVDGISGTLFSVWTPNADRVSVVGNFNGWDGRRHPMRCRGSSGVWELFLPGVSAGALYKFEIRNRHWGSLHIKSDPYAQASEHRPATASVVVENTRYTWQDQAWMSGRQGWQHAPISIYELHLGSWQRHADGSFWNYRDIADALVPYIQQLGFTHIELLPILEHPFDGSWGYQCTGYFAPTSRFGQPDDLRYLIDRCHQTGIGVYLDWVPGHFPKDEFALARFDGSALYEHDDWRRGEHMEWGTLIFNYGRNEIRSFLISSALYWLEEFHFDGLRVDAVASMLYLDYSRKDGEWLPNVYGGNENLEAVQFLRELNVVTHREAPGSVVMAEESTAWPQVTKPTYVGGLGFSMKWNMGWMHDTLRYISKQPIHRHYHHNDLTFGMLYAFSENFVLPFSHDEVVHGKGSMLSKMPGDRWQQFANLRLLYTYMFSYVGKKLLFMGAEIANPWEWNATVAMPWFLLDTPEHQGIHRALVDLNHLYRNTPALYQHDFDPKGFEWIDCHDAAQSVISYLRRGDDDLIVVALNFTPVPRHNYRIGVPLPGVYTEVFNSDSAYYGGSNIGNGGSLRSDPLPWMGQPHSVSLTLPPLAGVLLSPNKHSD